MLKFPDRILFYCRGLIFVMIKEMNRVRPLRHIDNLFDSNRHFLEKSAFGVCQFLGERMRINPARIRLYFIYSSFITFGSPFVLYLVIAFWLNVHKYISHGVKRILSE